MHTRDPYRNCSTTRDSIPMAHLLSRIEFENLASLEEFHSPTPTMLLQRPMDNMSTGTILESFKLGTANDDDSTIASDASPSTPTQQQVDSVSPVVQAKPVTLR